mgnify:CR=1 FL=1
MTPLPERFASAAERLVGTPFRLHGRTLEHGLDCVGVVLAALRSCGVTAAVTPPYGLRNASISAFLPLAAQLGLVEVQVQPRRGDVLLVIAGPAQHHLLVVTGADRFVHAHAGLRRVVVQRGITVRPCARHWRLSDR